MTQNTLCLLNKVLFNAAAFVFLCKQTLKLVQFPGKQQVCYVWLSGCSTPCLVFSLVSYLAGTVLNKNEVGAIYAI